MSRKKRYFKVMARCGYASRGLVYVVVGFFAVLGAWGDGDNKSSRDALETLLATPAGDLFAAMLFLGMLSFALWRYVQSLLDTDDHGFQPKGLVIRAGLLGSAITYTLLGIYTASLWLGNAVSSDNGNNPAILIAGVVGARPVSLALMLVFAGVAVAHFSKAFRGAYAAHFDAPAACMPGVHAVAISGLLARGCAFIVIAFLFFYRGLNPGEGEGATHGIADVLAFLQGLPFGSWLLLCMGAGLILFALYSFSQALWRRINVEDAG